MSNSKIGFCFMDRAPLDLYAFSKTKAERRQKTQQLKDKVIHDQAFVKGEVIFIYADGINLVERNLRRGRPPERAGESRYLERQTKKLKMIYKPGSSFCTSTHNAAELARTVARHALMGTYTPTDLTSIMNSYA